MSDFNPENFDYPLPDPSWDYATLWNLAHEAKNELNELISEMGKNEVATSASDEALCDQLARVQAPLIRLQGLLREETEKNG